MADGTDTPDAPATPASKEENDDRSALFRAEAVRHNTPGLFGEVALVAPPATWVLTALAIVALGVTGAMLAALDVDGMPLWRWLMSR